MLFFKLLKLEDNDFLWILGYKKYRSFIFFIIVIFNNLFFFRLFDGKIDYYNYFKLGISVGKLFFV